MDWRVTLADLNYGVEEADAVQKVVESRWLSMGAVTQQFEQAFARYVGVEYAFAVSNATVALHLAALSLGIGPGDEVIVPSLTFVATSNAMLYTGAEVRFADVVGSSDLTISPASIEQQITGRTKAIVVMHYAGYPCLMEPILEIARRHNLLLIEDAAHAPGASLHGQMLGAWGDVACFSFFSNKNLSTGEGGMIVTNRDDVAAKVKVLRSHGMTSLTWDRHKGHAYTYDVVDLGYNYRLDEIRAALGLVQLEKLPQGNARRKAITEFYRDALQETGLTLPFRDKVGEPAYHIFPVLLPEGTDRKAFIDKMRAAGIQTSIHYPPVHTFAYYRRRYPEVRLPVTESLAAREVTLPLYPGMSDEMAGWVVEAVGNALK